MTTDLRAGPSHRVLGVTWLVAAVPTAAVAFFLLVLAEQGDDRVAGLVLAALAVVAAVIGGWLLAGDRGPSPSLSLGASAVFVVAGVALYPTQQFAADAAWVCGVPVVAGLVTGLVALRSRSL